MTDQNWPASWGAFDARGKFCGRQPNSAPHANFVVIARTWLFRHATGQSLTQMLLGRLKRHRTAHSHRDAPPPRPAARQTGYAFHLPAACAGTRTGTLISPLEKHVGIQPTNLAFGVPAVLIWFAYRMLPNVLLRFADAGSCCADPKQTSSCFCIDRANLVTLVSSFLGIPVSAFFHGGIL